MKKEIIKWSLDGHYLFEATLEDVMSFLRIEKQIHHSQEHVIESTDQSMKFKLTWTPAKPIIEEFRKCNS